MKWNENDIYERLKGRETSLAVVGLGYVGLPVALEFAVKPLNTDSTHTIAIAATAMPAIDIIDMILTAAGLPRLRKCMREAV